MAVKGQSINVTLDPRGYKELNPLENRIPTHIDLRNGHYTDAKYWERRPGYLEILTLIDLSAAITPGDDDDDDDDDIIVDCDSVCPVGHLARAIYHDATVFGGPAIRVTALSSNAAARLVVALYFPSLSRIAIYWYNGESNAVLATLLGSVEYSLVDGDVLEIRAGARIAGVIQFSAYVNDIEVVGPVGDAGISESASCATFFTLTGIEIDVVVAGADNVVAGADRVVAL